MKLVDADVPNPHGDLMTQRYAIELGSQINRSGDMQMPNFSKQAIAFPFAHR